MWWSDLLLRGALGALGRGARGWEWDTPLVAALGSRTLRFAISMSQPLRALPTVPDAKSSKELLERAAKALGQVVLGKDREVRTCLTALVARGRVRGDDAPAGGQRCRAVRDFRQA